MKLTLTDCRSRLLAHDHAVLSTVHAERGVDAVPVVYAINGELLAIAVDTVKPKSSTRLQRQRNLDADPRATLLIDHWDRDDWSQLWWVRSELRFEPSPSEAIKQALADTLVERYVQYTDRPFADLLVLHIVNLTGWAAV